MDKFLGTEEDFLFYIKKAYEKGNIKAMNQMFHRFPSIAEKASNKYLLKEDFLEYAESEIPVEKTVLRMVSYLLGKQHVPVEYCKLLRETIQYQETFNEKTFRYQKVYIKEDLWNHYFLFCKELKRVISIRKINSIEELLYRTGEYYEKN